MRQRSGLQALPVALVCGLLSQCASAASTFQECARQVAARPDAYEPYRCYYEVANASGAWQAAGEQLAALAAAHPQSDWIVFIRGVVTWPLDKQAAEGFYLEAARRFAAAGNVHGEMLARANLQTLFYESGRIGSAAREVERVTALAARTADAELRIRARIVESQFFISTGANFARAQRALQQAEADLDAAPTYWLRLHVLHALGNVLSLTGKYDEAIGYFRRLHDEALARQDLSTMARARLSVVNALLEQRGEDPYAVGAARLFAEADAALRAAQRAHDVDLELTALRVLGEALMADQAGRARGYIDTCVEQARRHRRYQVLSECLWIRARLLADTDPSAARRTIDAAIELLQHEEGSNDEPLALAWRHAMRIAWQTQPAEVAIDTGKQALATIERLRDLQPGLEGRAVAFASWTQDYYWLSGQILRLAAASAPAGDPIHAARSRALLDEGFQIGERMRARSLLDRLKAPRAPVDGDAASRQRREALLKSIVEINRQLLKSAGHADAGLRRTLASLERQEQDLREAEDHPHVSAHPVSLADIQRRLAADEGLLSFQIGLRQGATDRFGGGSWLFAITRERVRVFELADRHSLARSLALFKGLIARSPAERARAGAVLHDLLLRDALGSMPASVRRLIIVPDAPLDTFPLGALAGSPDSAPLAQRYQLVLVPSATIWHEWRAHPAAPQARQALVLADPRLELALERTSQWRSWIGDSGLPSGRLPHARAEGRDIIGRLQGHGTLWTGSEASESALKAAELSRYGILHFATHTVVDSVNPQRSAILLAGGTREQDGLLQSREIPDLRLDGQLVALSSCQSATGAQVRGEGVLGLARSFFGAGARAVIGSLWPIRDDHAQAFFGPFYAALAEGRTTGAAFQLAQSRLIEQGLPVQAWAGFVLMGDADTTIASRAGGTGARWPAFVPALSALAGLLCVVAGVRRAAVRERRSQRSVTT